MPNYANGKICYIDIPSTDIERSARFYTTVFGWKMRKRGDGSTAFDDGVGEVSGTFTKGRPASSSPGMVVYVMVDNAQASLDSIGANGGRVVQPLDPNAREIAALFADPDGNVLGVYQQP